MHHYNDIMHFIQSSVYESVELLHNGTQLLSESCPRLKYTINTTSHSDVGVYTCRATLSDGTSRDVPLGIMAIIGKGHKVYLRVIILMV